MLNVIDKQRKATGLAYNTDDQRFRDHHAALDQSCVWLDRQLEEGDIVKVSELAKSAKDAIDTAAGKARERYVSKGYLIEEEYRLAKIQTQQWRDSGSPTDAVPETVQAWADAMGSDAKTAAQDIEATAAAWEQVIQSIRSLRLAGKAAVEKATSQSKEKDMTEVAQPFVDQLNAMQP